MFSSTPADFSAAFLCCEFLVQLRAEGVLLDSDPRLGRPLEDFMDVHRSSLIQLLLCDMVHCHS